MYKLILFWVTLLAGVARSAKILGILPFYGTSHNLVTMPLFEELAKRGHQVTVAGYHEPKTPHKNLKFILFKPKPGTQLRGYLDAADYVNSNHMTTMYLLNWILGGYPELMEMNNYNRILDEKSYDLAIIEFFESDLFNAYAEKLGLPFIVFHTCEAFPWHRDALADPISPSLIPQVFGQAEKMDFTGRLCNTIEVIQMMIYYRTVLLPSAQKMATHFIGNVPPLDEITKNASLYFVNTHNSLYGPRPVNPSTIEIGGIHMKPAKPLPKVNNYTKLLLGQAMRSMIGP